MDTGSQFVLHSLRRDPCLTLVRGENARLWDADGRLYLAERFRALAGRSAVIGDVRGPGLFVGIDYVLDAGTKEPATAACADAWQYAARRGLLCQFGGIGGNVLKFKPPLTTPDDDFEQMLSLVEDVTGFIEERVTGRITAGV